MLQKTRVLLVANSEGSLEASSEEAMHMFMYPEKIAGQNHNKIKYVRVKGLLRTLLNKIVCRKKLRAV